MFDFRPSSSKANNNDASFVIINGRRVPVGAGLSGREMTSMTGSAKNRRTVVIGNGRTKLLDPNRVYKAKDLTDGYHALFEYTLIADRDGVSGKEDRQEPVLLLFTDILADQRRE